MDYEEDDNDGEPIIRQITQGDSKTIMRMMRMMMTRMRMKIKRIMMITLMRMTMTIGMMTGDW